MRFLLDQDVYAITTRFLAGLGHDVVTASGIGLAAADDAALLRHAQDGEGMTRSCTVQGECPLIIA